MSFFSAFKTFLPSIFKPNVEIAHETLGQMVFMDGYWEAESNGLFHAIPGDESGPDESSIQFIFDKLDTVDHYWKLCQPKLLEAARNRELIDDASSAKDLFELNALSVGFEDKNEWEICFETSSEQKRLHMCVLFRGETIIGTDVTA